MSDTDEYSDRSDDDTDVDRKPEEHDETDIEQKNVSVPNKDKNQNTVPKTSSANSQTKCKYCKRVYSCPSSLERHIMAIHRPTFVKCPISSCMRQIKTVLMYNHLRRTHSLSKKQVDRHTSNVS